VNTEHENTLKTLPILKYDDHYGIMSDDDEGENDTTNYVVILKANEPLFILDAEKTTLSSNKVCISNDDKYLILVWSRWFSIIDIDSKACIFKECGEYGYIGDLCITNYENGFSLKYTKMLEDEDLEDIEHNMKKKKYEDSYEYCDVPDNEYDEYPKYFYTLTFF
jgi:hypothetical protein